MDSLWVGVFVQVLIHNCAQRSAPTGYFSSGSMTRASPKMVLQYSAILACCLALMGVGGGEASPKKP